MKKNILATVLVVIGMCASPGVWADKGGIPNERSCNPGNASHCQGSNGGSHANAPELDIAGMPLAIGLLTALILWRLDRKV